MQSHYIRENYGIGGAAFGGQLSVGGASGPLTPPVTPEAEVETDCHGHNIARNTIEGTQSAMKEGLGYASDALGVAGSQALIQLGVGAYVLGVTNILARGVDGTAHLFGAHEGCEG